MTHIRWALAIIAIGAFCAMAAASGGSLILTEGKQQVIQDGDVVFTIKLLSFEGNQFTSTFRIGDTRTTLECKAGNVQHSKKGEAWPSYDCAKDNHVAVTLLVLNKKPENKRIFLAFSIKAEQVQQIQDGPAPETKTALSYEKQVLKFNVPYRIKSARVLFKVRKIAAKSADFIYDDEPLSLIIDVAVTTPDKLLCIRLLNANPTKNQVYVDLEAPAECQTPATTGTMRKAASPFSSNQISFGLFAYPFPKDDLNGYKNAYNKFLASTGVTPTIYLNYINYGGDFKTDWAKLAIQFARQNGKKPIIQIAYEPIQGCKTVKADAYLKKFMTNADSLGVPVLLRFASEFNGKWVPYYEANPKDYINCFNTVSKAAHTWTKNVYMVWSVFPNAASNVKFEEYYPGDDYVDLVGVSAYFTPIFPMSYLKPEMKDKGLDEIFPLVIDPIYQFADKHKKDLVVSEGGLSTYYQRIQGDSPIYRDWTTFAFNGIERLYFDYPTSHTRLKAIVNFEADLPKINPEKVKSWSIVLDCNQKNPSTNCKLANEYRQAISKYTASTSSIKVA